jgi:hypothetical protein
MSSLFLAVRLIEERARRRIETIALGERGTRSVEVFALHRGPPFFEQGFRDGAIPILSTRPWCDGEDSDARRSRNEIRNESVHGKQR